MEQQQLISFATKYDFFATSDRRDGAGEFRLNDPDYESFAFLPRAKPGRRQLTATQIRHLQIHYITARDDINGLRDPRFNNMDTTVQVWHRCRVDKEVFHCEQYRQADSTRLNHLARISQTTDLNENFREGTRPEIMQVGDYYVYIKFFCVHEFEGVTSMLMYSEYRRVSIIDGLVKDNGHWVDGFQDVFVLENLCGRCTRGKRGEDQTVWFIDNGEKMNERLKKALRLR